MKQNKILIIILILIIGTFSFHWFKNYSKKVKDEHCLATQISSTIFDFNTFNLKVDTKLNINDFIVIDENSGNTIFTNGKPSKGIENDYGHRTFQLYYKDKIIFKTGHFITDNWVTNDYSLNIRLKNNEIDPTLVITGTNASYRDFFYKKFEYDINGSLIKTIVLSKGKEVTYEEYIK